MANSNFTFTDLTEALPALCKELLAADEVGSRNGRTRELTHVGITYTDPLSREILNPARQHSIAAQVAETAWVLAGRDDVDWLEHYLPRAKDFSDNGKTWSGAYGRRIRKWRGRGGVKTDQLRQVVNTLRTDPLSRQAVISIWDPGFDNQKGLKDRPCNDTLIFTNRLGKLDLHVLIRSNDFIWGHSGVNYFEWSVLLEVVAGLVGVSVGKLHFSIASLHIYDKHWVRAEKIAETSSWTSSVFGNVWPGTRFDPRAVGRSLKSFDRLLTQWFKIESKIRSNHEHVDEMIVDFPESMLRSWLWILRWWNTGDDAYLNEIDGTVICASARLGVQPKAKEPRFEEKIVEVVEIKANGEVLPMLGTDFQPPIDSDREQFAGEALQLHKEKSEAYGDSWKRRGEVLGILANIARKVDRIKSGLDTSDETSADTALDLYIYAAMYRWWLVDQKSAPWPTTDDMGFYNGFSDHPVVPVNTLMRKLFKTTVCPDSREEMKKTIDKNFGEIEHFVIGDGRNRSKSDDKHLVIVVDELVVNALWLAYDLWLSEQDQYRGADVD